MFHFQYIFSFYSFIDIAVFLSFLALKYIPQVVATTALFECFLSLPCHQYQDEEVGAEPDSLNDACCFSFAIISFSL